MTFQIYVTFFPLWNMEIYLEKSLVFFFFFVHTKLSQQMMAEL